jgi:hypothetical protein
MKVYLLIHEEDDYDSEFEVRGVYRHSNDAKAALITKTPAGNPSKAWDAHNNSCCSVMEYDVLDAPQLDIKDDPPPPDPNAIPLIRDDVADAFVKYLLNPTWFDRPIGRVTDIVETDEGISFTFEALEEPEQ